MKAELQQQAKNLYFDTNLTKSEIADKIGVNRRTIMLWCRQGNWDRLKMSARHLPAMVAEKCYYLIDHLATELLTDGTKRSITNKDADAINKLASGIKKLKNRNSVNECMEMFNFFLEDLKNHDVQLVETIRPHMERYIRSRNDVEINDFLLEEFNNEGYISWDSRASDEKIWDKMDKEALEQELQITPDYDAAIENWQNPRKELIV